MADDKQPGTGTVTQPAAPQWIGGFAPAHIGGEPEPKPEEKPVEAKPEPEKKPEQPKSSIADAIRQQREAREAREKQAKAEAEKDARIRELEAQVAGAGESPLKDPVRFARTHKMSKDEQALFAQTLLYDLMPEKAPPDLRARLLELRLERERTERDETDKQRAARQKAEQEQALVNNYVAELRDATSTFEAGTYPESEDWFGGDQETYVRSLFATMMNMSKAGQRDLSPAKVAAVLEADVAGRMKRRDERASGRKTKAEPAPKAAGETQVATGQTESTKGMTGGGAPRGPAMTEAERVQRAIEAGWGGR